MSHTEKDGKYSVANESESLEDDCLINKLCYVVMDIEELGNYVHKQRKEEYNWLGLGGFPSLCWLNYSV